MYLKNTSGQHLEVVAFDYSSGAPKTGDSANITAYVNIDDGGYNALTDTSATEVDSTNKKGLYVFDLSQAETNGTKLAFYAKSSTSSVMVIATPRVDFTQPATGILAPATAGRTLVVDASGLADANAVKVGPSGSGTSQTARDLGASVLLSSGTGTGQLDFTSGVVKANATQWLGGTIPAVNVTGVPKVDVVDWLGTAPLALTSQQVQAVVPDGQKVDINTIKTNPVVNAGTVTFPTGATLASTTNITAGTITTTTNLTNAPTSGDFTSTMKTSIGTAVAASAVASVTGNVGGDVTGSVGSVSSGVTLADGVAHGGSTATLELGSSSTNPFYVHCSAANHAAILVTGGSGASGIASVGGTGGWGIQGVGGAASGSTPAGHGFLGVGGDASTTSGGLAGAGFYGQGGAGAASTNGAGDGLYITGGGTTTVSGGHGASLVHTGSVSDFNATSTPLTLAKTTNITGLNDIAATAIVSSGAITTSGGAVSTVTNLTNAPTSGDFTSTMKTSIGTAVAASAVASVTGNVGGNVTGTVGGLTAAALADFFTVDSTKTYADAVAGSVVSEIATNAGSGGGGTDWTTTERSQIRYRLGLDGATNTPTATPTLSTLDAAGVRTAVGLGSANLDTQLNTIYTDVGLVYSDTQAILPLANGTSGFAAIMHHLLGLVPVATTVGTSNTTTHVILAGVTGSSDDDLNNWGLLLYDNSATRYYLTAIVDWTASGTVATVDTLPFTPEDSVDSYWLLPTAAIANVTRIGGTPQAAGLDLITLAAGTTGFNATKSVVDAVKAKTDQMVFTISNLLDVNALGWAGHTATADGGGFPIVSGVSAIDTNVDTLLTAATAIQAKTDHLPDSDIVNTSGKLWVLDGSGNAVANNADMATLLSRIGGSLTISGGKVAATLGSTDYSGNTVQTGDAYARLGAPAGASLSADVAAVKTDTGNLVTRITSSLFSGITSLAQWLGLLAGKQIGNSTARTELRATGAGSGSFDETTDSQEALRDRGDASWAVPSHFTNSTFVSDGVFSTAALANAPSGGGGGGGTVTGYASGQDPATLVLGALASSWNTTGTIGAKINAAGGAADPLANPLGNYTSGTAGGALQLIGAAQVVTSSSVAQNGNFKLVRGVDYSADENRALDWQDSSNTWPVLTGATITVTIYFPTHANYTGSVVTATGDTKKVRWEPTDTITGDISYLGRFDFRITATLTNGHIVELVAGKATISDT